LCSGADASSYCSTEWSCEEGTDGNFSAYDCHGRVNGRVSREEVIKTPELAGAIIWDLCDVHKCRVIAGLLECLDNNGKNDVQGGILSNNRRKNPYSPERDLYMYLYEVRYLLMPGGDVGVLGAVR